MSGYVFARLLLRLNRRVSLSRGWAFAVCLPCACRVGVGRVPQVPNMTHADELIQGFLGAARDEADLRRKDGKSGCDQLNGCVFSYWHIGSCTKDINSVQVGKWVMQKLKSKDGKKAAVAAASLAQCAPCGGEACHPGVQAIHVMEYALFAKWGLRCARKKGEENVQGLVVDSSSLPSLSSDQEELARARVEEIDKQRLEMAESEAKKTAKTGKKRCSRSAKAGITFPVGRVHRALRQGPSRVKRVGRGAPVYLAIVLEYLAAEILEIAGIYAKTEKKVRIAPRHINRAIRDDAELSKLLADVTVAGGGVVPLIHSALLPKKP